MQTSPWSPFSSLLFVQASAGFVSTLVELPPSAQVSVAKTTDTANQDSHMPFSVFVQKCVKFSLVSFKGWISCSYSNYIRTCAARSTCAKACGPRGGPLLCMGGGKCSQRASDCPCPTMEAKQNLPPHQIHKKRQPPARLHNTNQHIRG